MRNSQRFLVAILFSVGALSLLLLSNQVTRPQAAGVGQAFPPSLAVDPALHQAASTVTASVTVTGPLVIPTRLSLALSSNPIRQGQRLTISINLFGQNQGQNASVSNQQVSITSSWGSSVNCITQNDGTCHLEINAPSSAGNYLITAKYSGNIFFASSTATASLKVQ